MDEENFGLYMRDFQDMDKDGDRLLSKEEMTGFCEAKGINVDELFA